MSDSKKAVIVIPFYKSNLTAYELIALQQCFKVLSDHPVIAIKPAGLILPPEVTAYPFLTTVSFDDDYFRNVQSYNRLMLSADFYKEFLSFEYILIYQLDAFVFKDELNYWCSQGFDYIGAPWIREIPYSFFKSIKRNIQYYIHTRYNIQKNGLPSPKQFEYKVGNGGFSLRKTRKFYELCIKFSDKINHYNSQEHHLYNEDVFWGVEVNRKQRNLRIPGYRKALKFSVEFHPQRAFIINKGQLPFGCHAWDLTLDFWRPVFEEFGYVI
jgi:hypothetical protein